MQTGRNDPCPCGSGRKLKKCHGREPFGPPHHDAGLAFERAAAAEHQRKEQQGLGRPISSTQMDETRFVTVGGRVLHSRAWKTFHDFLSSYLVDALGSEWLKIATLASLPHQHAVATWYSRYLALQKQHEDPQREIHSAPLTAAAQEWLKLAYDAYCLEHNAEVQRTLLHRLKHPQQFPGARHETFVAASLLRAGFDIEFEDENDGRSTHCELTAIHKTSGHRFSVEAKRRFVDARSPRRLRLGRPLRSALVKQAVHERIVFLEVVKARSAESDGISVLRDAIADIQRCEFENARTELLPAAYVIVTSSDDGDLDGPPEPVCGTFYGFRIADFRPEQRFPTLRETLATRAKHSEVFALIESIKKHSAIPATFDGSPPGLAFSEQPRRFLVGEWYRVPQSTYEVIANLEHATADWNTGEVHCVYVAQQGQRLLIRDQLTAMELETFREHPETFFGVRDCSQRLIERPIELFDFFYEFHGNKDREGLLEQLANAADIEFLKSQNREELALTLCERLTLAAWKQRNRSR